MPLLFIIAIISLLMTFSAEIVRLVQKLGRRKSNIPPELQASLNAANAEVTRLQAEKFQYSDRIDCKIRLLRAQDKVNQLKAQIVTDDLTHQFKGYMYNKAVNYGFKSILSLILCFISWRNLRNPVFIFGDAFNLQPLTGLLCFPTGVQNGISVPVWALSCNVTFKFVHKYLKTKLKF